MRVVVLGAGVVGTAIAEVLARRGAEVTVLDTRPPGRGASQASAGMLAPYVEGRHHQALLDLGVRSAALFPTFVARLTETTGLPVEYEQTGTLEIALDDLGAAELVAAKAWLDKAGVSAELLDASALTAFEPTVTRTAVAGLFINAHGFVSVSPLIAALVQSAKVSGAVFETPVEAATVQSRREAAEVRAGDRTYTADAVVIATGSWSRRVRIANVAALPVRPVRGQILHLTWPAPPQPRRVVWGPRCYAVPFPNGSMLVGATAEDAGFDEFATVAGVKSLVTALTELLPVAERARWEAVRVGLRPALPDDLPAIGPVSRAPRVTVATGHYRNGVLLAPVTAEIVARSVLDGDLDPAVRGLSPDRFIS